MPRGGSRKGERRGNAKARTGLETPNEVMRGAVKLVRKPGIGKGKTTGPTYERIEEDLLTSQIVHGRSSVKDLSPKEIMLDNMHAIYEKALTSKAMGKFVLQSMPEGEERAELLNRLEQDEISFRRMSSDEAYKVAPFIHPRLSAVAVTRNTETSANIVRTMLDEIDRLNREHPMVIEHIPTKKTA